MSMMMNEGVNMRCKEVTYNLFTVAGLFVEPSTEIEKRWVLFINIFILSNIT